MLLKRLSQLWLDRRVIITIIMLLKPFSDVIKYPLTYCKQPLLSLVCVVVVSESGQPLLECNINDGQMRGTKVITQRSLHLYRIHAMVLNSRPLPISRRGGYHLSITLLKVQYM